jgi:hypothetical protein
VQCRVVSRWAVAVVVVVVAVVATVAELMVAATLS